MENAQHHLSSRIGALLVLYKAPAIMAVVVRRHGAYAATAMRGVRKIDLAPDAPGNPVQDNDPFPTGSCSKPIGGYMLANFLKLTQYNWETTIGEVFPELNSSYCRKHYHIRDDFLRASIRDMMSHTARFLYSPTHGTNSMLSGLHANFDERQIEEYCSRRAEMQRRYNYMITSQQDVPGALNVYNGGPTLPVAMLERITGKSYQKLMQEYVFDPLEMDGARIGLQTTTASKPDGPWPHWFDFDQLKFVPDAPRLSRVWRYEAHNPGGNVQLTAADAVKFIQAQMVNGTGRRPLHGTWLTETFNYYRGDCSVSGWLVPKRTIPPTPAADYALSHDGDDGNCRARFVIWPHRGEGYFISTNCSGSGTLDGKPDTNIGLKIVDAVAHNINDMLPRWETDFDG